MTDINSGLLATFTYPDGIDGPAVAVITAEITGRMTAAPCGKCNAWQVLDIRHAPLLFLAVRHEDECRSLERTHLRRHPGLHRQE